MKRERRQCESEYGTDNFEEQKEEEEKSSLLEKGKMKKPHSIVFKRVCSGVRACCSRIQSYKFLLLARDYNFNHKNSNLQIVARTPPLKSTLEYYENSNINNRYASNTHHPDLLNVISVTAQLQSAMSVFEFEKEKCLDCLERTERVRVHF